MKVCTPHMGTVYVPLKALIEGLGAEMIVPPPCSRRTLSLGTQYSPEFVCLPYKLVIGNFIEGLEMGADTLVMVEGDRICRLGYYMRVMEGALCDLGHDFRLITTRLFERGLFGIPDFRSYTLAEGIASILNRADKGPARRQEKHEPSGQLRLFDPTRDSRQKALPPADRNIGEV